MAGWRGSNMYIIGMILSVLSVIIVAISLCVFAGYTLHWLDPDNKYGLEAPVASCVFWFSIMFSLFGSLEATLSYKEHNILHQPAVKMATKDWKCMRTNEQFTKIIGLDKDNHIVKVDFMFIGDDVFIEGYSIKEPESEDKWIK